MLKKPIRSLVIFKKFGKENYCPPVDLKWIEPSKNMYDSNRNVTPMTSIM